MMQDDDVEIIPLTTKSTTTPRGVLPYESSSSRLPSSHYGRANDDYLANTFHHSVEEVMLQNDQDDDDNYPAPLGPPRFMHGEETKPEYDHHQHTAVSEQQQRYRVGVLSSPDQVRRSSAWSGNSPHSPRSSSPFGMNLKGHERAPSSGYNTPLPGGGGSAAAHLRFAEGDFIEPTASNAFSRFVFAVFEQSFLFRWIIYIIPLLILIWIPGILGITAFPDAKIASVPLMRWSIFVSVVWVAWFAAALISRILPPLLRNTIGIVALGTKNYINYIDAIQFYVGAMLFALVAWVAFQPLVQVWDLTQSSATALDTIASFLRAVFIILCLLLGEKLVIQLIAHDFHKKSFADRILEQKFQIQALVALYLNSRDIGRIDTANDGEYSIRPKHHRKMTDPTVLVKKALHGAKRVGQTAASMFGTVASEFASERIVNLVPNSPEAMVSAALNSSSKTKQLARRIYFSFTPSDRNVLFITDIAPCFRDQEMAERAFAIFDKDTNGDVTLEEMELSCLDVHCERKALLASMTDIDSAVAKLDSILIVIWNLISLLVLITSLVASFSATLTGAGTLVLSFSWLFSTTAQEILGSFIFVFIKHSLDVGDRVDIDGESYTVKEMHLLSTVFQRTDGTITQAPNNQLNLKFIHNIRRSGPISEKFEWNVAFDTSFEKIESLRNRMLEFLERERRDFLPKISIVVQNFADQSKISLSADIQFRTNWQNGALKASRRNKWICALKVEMAQLNIYGPLQVGKPDHVAITHYSKVPYVPPPTRPTTPKREELAATTTGIQLTDQGAVFDDGETLFAGR